MELPKRQGVVSTVQDLHRYIPLSDQLQDGDMILLLTPGIVPEVSPLNRNPNEPTRDPFEPLGRALARHHPRVHHVPYMPRNGITDTHLVHIALATVVIFVISGPPCYGQPSQVALAQHTKSLCESRPLVILTCCELRELGPLEKSFSTILEVPSFVPFDLEVAADVLFQPRSTSPGLLHIQDPAPPRRAWPVEVWDANRDVSEVLDLWRQCLEKIFHLDRYQFQSLLRRDGYAMHYAVREPGTSRILGFCATYTTYVDSDGERLLGSLAVLLVHPSHRQQGIGRSLHDHALRQLKRIRGVCCLRLGSTFPRLLYGLPDNSQHLDWFRRRGWPIAPPSSPASSEQVARDWLLKFKDWPVTGMMLSELTFRPCTLPQFDQVLEFVDRESRKKDNMGWYDQYARLANTMNIEDIILGLDGSTIIAAALTYAKKTGSPAADDLPWASTIADDVGGVTCVCVSGTYSHSPPGRSWGDMGKCGGRGVYRDRC